MTEQFRRSPFIDFATGEVALAPMELVAQKAKPWSIDDRVELFHCRVDVWQLGVAVALLRKIEDSDGGEIWAHAAYGMLSISFAYFEMIGKILNPASASSRTAGVDFNYGFCDVYPQLKPQDGDYSNSNSNLALVHNIRDRVRNGLYHLAYTKNNLWIHNDPAISSDDFSVSGSGSRTTYNLNPHRVVRTVVAHFPGLVRQLSSHSNVDLREKFKDFFDDFHQG